MTKNLLYFPVIVRAVQRENIMQQLEREGQMDSGGVREERANK